MLTLHSVVTIKTMKNSLNVSIKTIASVVVVGGIVVLAGYSYFAKSTNKSQQNVIEQPSEAEQLNKKGLATNKTNWNVQEISSPIEWNRNTGIPYERYPGVNLGATSFQVLDNERIAFLSDVSNEIIVINTSTGKSISRFPVAFGARDFVFNQGMFYLLAERELFIYDKTGQQIKSLPSRDGSAARIFRFKNATYLQLPSGNSLKIESNNQATESKEQEGWITQSGNYVTTKRNGDNTYSVKVITPSGNMFEKTFTADKKVAGIFVVGSTSNRLTLDLQKFLSENPVSVERLLLSVSITETGIGDIVISKKLPECYYVLSTKDLDVALDGTIYNMVTSPQGTHIFALTESNGNQISDYPTFLKETKYHFNDNLIKVD